MATLFPGGLCGTSVAEALRQLPRSGCVQCYCAGQVEMQLAGNLDWRAALELFKRRT